MSDLIERLRDLARCRNNPIGDALTEAAYALEAARMENKGHSIAIQQLYDRAERLEEALREAQKLFEWNAIGGPLRRRIDALLHDHDQEAGNE